VKEGPVVRFWMDAYLNPQKTKEAGRNIYDTVPWCEIQAPGERDNVRGPVHRLFPDPRVRFPEAWEQWKRDNSTEGMVGTPLKMVSWLEPGEVETLKYAGIRTLEDLADLHDGNVTKVPGGLALRKRAQDVIRAAKEEAPLQRMSEENAKLSAEVAALREQVSALAQGRPLPVPERRKPGRPRKVLQDRATLVSASGSMTGTTGEEQGKDG
jgi:hypothetical protein